MRLRGRKAAKVLKALIDKQRLTIELPPPYSAQQVRLVEWYKHLGNVVTMGGSMMQEMTNRMTATMSAYIPLAIKIFGSPHVTLELKMQFVDTLLLTRLLYNSHTWVLKPGETKKLNSTYMRVLRRIVQDCRHGPCVHSDLQVRRSLNAPSIECFVFKKNV